MTPPPPENTEPMKVNISNVKIFRIMLGARGARMRGGTCSPWKLRFQ